MIDDALSGWLAPLERFEAMRKRYVRLGDRIVDLTYPNPPEGMLTGVRRVIEQALSSDRSLDFQYTPYGGLGPIRRAVADDLATRFDLRFDPADVVLTPGAMAALHLGLRLAVSTGDEVVIPTPCWLDHPLYAESCGATPRLVPLQAPEMRLDAAPLRGAIGPRTRALLFTQPGNPTGVSHTLAELEAIAAVLREAEQAHGTTITWICDQAHRDLAPPAASPTHVWPRTVLVYSFGKSNHIQGQRTGYIAVSPSHPERVAAQKELERWVRITGAYAPTTLMQRAIPGLLALEHPIDALLERRARVTEALRGGGYEVCRGDGTFFVYVRHDHDDDDAYVASLAAAGVLVLPSTVFHHHGWFRIALTQTGDVLDRGIAKLIAHRKAGQ